MTRDDPRSGGLNILSRARNCDVIITDIDNILHVFVAQKSVITGVAFSIVRNSSFLLVGQTTVGCRR